MATTPHDRTPSRPDHWCHIEYHPGPPAGRWRTTCECGWISNWSATSAGLLELLPLDGRLRPVGTRTVASCVTSEHVVVLVGYNEPFRSYFAQWGPVVSADSGPWDFVGDVGADLVGECPSVDELVAADDGDLPAEARSDDGRMRWRMRARHRLLVEFPSETRHRLVQPSDDPEGLQVDDRPVVTWLGRALE